MTFKAREKKDMAASAYSLGVSHWEAGFCGDIWAAEMRGLSPARGQQQIAKWTILGADTPATVKPLDQALAYSLHTNNHHLHK